MPRSQPHLNADAFLAAYRQVGNITEAAAAATVDRGMHYRWLKSSEAYVAAFAAACKAFEELRLEMVDSIEAGAIKRARDGVLEPVFYQGIKCGAVRRWPEGTVQFLLRAHKPATYASKTELTGPGGGPIEVNLADILLERRRKRLAAAAAAAAVKP